MNKETLQKFYPVIIGFGLLVPVVSYFLFFAGSGNDKTAARDPTGPTAPPTKKGGFDDYPKKDDSVVVGGKSVTLQSLRDAAADTSGDSKNLVGVINTISDANDLYAMPQLITLLNNNDPYVRGRAGVAAQKILGADFGFKANMPEADRKKVGEIMRAQLQHIMAKMNNPEKSKR